MLAVLAGVLGDLDLAEDALQEAFVQAVRTWPTAGVPANPAGWLLTTARNRAIDRIRREKVLAAKLPLLAATPEEDPVQTAVVPDERLELIFTCCHPALAQDAQVSLVLRALGCLSTEEIAAAFLVPPETMKKRLTRAKTKIREAGIPFRVPAAHELPDRLAVVLTAVYLIHNEGYGGAAPLAAEAIRLGRLLHELMPDEGEVTGLLALMLLHESRAGARVVGGERVLLHEQDRGRWDRALVAEGRALLDGAIRRGRGPYVLQAAVESLHCDDVVDWREVAALYAELVALTGSAVVELNRAVAVAEAGSPQDALAIVDRLDLDGYAYLHATRAELLTRLDRPGEARAAYDRAIALSRDDAERRLLARRRDAVTAA